MNLNKRKVVTHQARSIRVSISFLFGGYGTCCSHGRLMERRLRTGLLLIVAIVILKILSPNAYAQQFIAVKPGEQLPIVTSDKPIVNKSGTLKGIVTLDDSGAQPGIHRLIYKAPAESDANFTETIRFSENGVDRELSVRVTGSDVYSESFKSLFVVFILAILLESGLSVIFNWRPFLQNFDARGVKTIVSIVVAYIFINYFKLDMVAHLVNVYGNNNLPPSFLGKLLTAFIVAGGSSGVNNLLIALGYRSMKTVEQISPKPAYTEAWVAVRLIRKNAVGPVVAMIGPDENTLAVAGIIVGESKNKGLLRYFFVDRGRFPVAGGYPISLVTGKKYAVKLEGKDTNDKSLSSLLWGPHLIAPGAIIDIEISL